MVIYNRYLNHVVHCLSVPILHELYGFTNVPELDVYGGAMFSYNIAKYSSDGDDASYANSYGSGVGFTGFIGGRWFFTDRIGAFAELGYGVSVLNAGVTY